MNANNAIGPKDPFLERLVQVLQEYGAERVVLFGSRARGNADAYSDYDVVVIKTTEKPFVERLAEVASYRSRLGRAVDILVYTPQEWEGMWERGLRPTVEEEGVLLYEKPGR